MCAIFSFEFLLMCELLMKFSSLISTSRWGKVPPGGVESSMVIIGFEVNKYFSFNEMEI